MTVAPPYAVTSFKMTYGEQEPGWRIVYMLPNTAEMLRRARVNIKSAGTDSITFRTRP